MSSAELAYLAERARVAGNFQQKKHPVNPVEYLRKFDINSVFRFVLTHPDMDHMDGIKDFFECFSPANFYDSDNNKEMEFPQGSPYNEEDWKFYKKLRDTKPQTNPKRIPLFSGDDNFYRTMDWHGNRPGDSFYILAPTPGLVQQANETEDYNDTSYVILYHGASGRILLSGDSHDNTWEHILDKWKDIVKDVDLLIAPHHGRKSGRSYDFLDTVNPKMTFFGNARSEHLAYSAWQYRKLEYITNNQANCMVVDCSKNNLTLYVTYETFARKYNPYTFHSKTYDAWYLKEITGWDLQ
jgi:metal-dependent hydrolase (beta-lactamase superfamily II)